MKNTFLNSLKKAAVFFVLFPFAVQLQAQQFNLDWAGKLDGKGGGFFEEARAIAVDRMGNTYVTGIYLDSLDADPGPGVYRLTSPMASGSDIFILKLDPQGNFLWAKSLNGPVNDDRANAISVDSAGNIFTTGYFYGTMDFDPGSGVYNLTTTANGYDGDIYISKLDTDGNFVWAKQIGGNNIDAAYALTTDITGNVIVTGFVSTSTDVDPGPGVFLSTPMGMLILKLDAAGNFIWAKQLGDTNAYPSASSIKIGQHGELVLTGAFTGTVDFDPGNGVAELSSQGQGIQTAAFVLKLDTAGNFNWVKSFSGNNNFVRSYDIVLDDTGNIYSTGLFFGTADFDPGSNVYNLVSTNDLEESFITKLDPSGNFVWAIKRPERTAAMALDASNNIYLTGADLNYVVTKLDNNGNLINTTAFPGDGTSKGGRVIWVNTWGDIYLAGTFGGTTDFDPGITEFNMTSEPNGDIFIQKLNQVANPVTISFLSFTGTQNANRNQLKWTTTTGNSNDNFQLERSTDSVHFLPIAIFNGTRNPSASQAYTYGDNVSVFEKFYYRVKHINRKGLLSYSTILSLCQCENPLPVTLCSPNPAKNFIRIGIDNNLTNASIRLFNFSGKAVMTRSGISGNGALINIADLQPGIYMAELYNQGKKTVVKFVKQ